VIGLKNPKEMQTVALGEDLTRDVDVLVQPGYSSSGEEHWQTYWEQAYGYRRIEQSDWLKPRLDDWVATIEHAVETATRPVVFAAHSLGCIAIVHWAITSQLTSRVRGALLVAPPDVELGEHMPDDLRGFAPIPRQLLPFRSIVIASRNDPYMEAHRSRELAAAWGSEYRDFGMVGHINSDTRLGLWPEGHAELLRLTRT
jgi:predicted alpha/beta hydrolase family esterase